MGNEIDKGIEAGTSSGKKPDKSKFKETSKRLRAGPEGNLKHRASLEWRLDQSRVCNAGGHDATTIPLEELQTIILSSRTGMSLLTGAGTKDLSIVYDMQTPASQLYIRDGKQVIALNPLRPVGELINLLSRELRRAWQYRHGALVNPLSFEPDEAILVNRAQVADTLMIAIKISWELKLNGLPEAWEFHIHSPFADIGRTFEIKAKADFRTLNNGEAARAAYDKFFEDARTRLHDKRIIHQMLLDESGYIKHAQHRPKVSMDLFKRLGELPHGRNYLSMKSSRAPVDMAYATVEDRSNANFLWFIKFERSFQEKELQMVAQSVKLSAEIVDFAKWSVSANRRKEEVVA